MNMHDPSFIFGLAMLVISVLVILFDSMAQPGERLNGRSARPVGKRVKAIRGAP